MDSFPLSDASLTLFTRLYQGHQDAQNRLQEFLVTTGAALGVEGEGWVFDLPTKSFRRAPVAPSPVALEPIGVGSSVPSPDAPAPDKL